MIKERDWDFCASTISMAFCVTGIEWALLNIMVSLSPKVIIWRLLALSSLLWKILWETSRLCAELLLLLFNLGEIDVLIHLNHARGKPPLVGVLFSLSMDATFEMQSPSTFFTHYQHLFPRRLILRMDTVELCRHFRSVFMVSFISGGYGNLMATPFLLKEGHVKRRFGSSGEWTTFWQLVTLRGFEVEWVGRMMQPASREEVIFPLADWVVCRKGLKLSHSREEEAWVMKNKSNTCIVEECWQKEWEGMKASTEWNPRWSQLTSNQELQ